MENIPPEVARKLLNRDFTNLISRMQAGGKLTRAERNMLQAMAAGMTAFMAAFMAASRAYAGPTAANPCPDKRSSFDSR